MKKTIVAALFAVLSVVTPALANPFRYQATCYLDLPDNTRQVDNCVVIETRDKNDSLDTRSIFSNRFGITIKTRWDGVKYVTWDSRNKTEYTWIYKPNESIQKGGVTATYVMPGFSVLGISFD